MTEAQSHGAHFALPAGAMMAPGRYAFESARAALCSYLQAAGVRRLHVPSYTCAAVMDAAHAAKVEVVAFNLDDELQPTDLNLDGEEERVLLIDYFGLSGSQVDKAIAGLPREIVICDQSQAWFAPAREGVAATIWSPRKFFPAPDGGIIATSIELAQQASDEAASHRRLKYLVDRIGAEPDASRDAYLAAESELEDINARRMSFLSGAIIDAIDDAAIAEVRRANFDQLDRLLGHDNRRRWELGGQVPLCYPFSHHGDGLRARLLNRRLFVPAYWPGASASSPVEKLLRDETVYLPIDHRYGQEDMERIAAIVREEGGLGS